MGWRWAVALSGAAWFAVLPLWAGGERPRAVAAHAHAAEGGAVFTPNGGQWPDEVRFRTRLEGGAIWLTDAGWTSEWWGPAASHGAQRSVPDGPGAWGWTLTWEGANTDAPAAGDRPSSHTESYYFGSDPARWASRLGAARRRMARIAKVLCRNHGRQFKNPLLTRAA